jgi:hypothetical protein
LVRLAFPFQNAPTKLTELASENMGRFVTAALKAKSGDYSGAREDAAKAIRYLAVVGGIGTALAKWSDSDVTDMMIHVPLPVQVLEGISGNIVGKPNKYSSTPLSAGVPIVGEFQKDVDRMSASGILKFIIPDEAMRVLSGINKAPIPQRFNEEEWRRQFGIPSVKGQEAALERLQKAKSKQEKEAMKFYQTLGINP